MLISSIKSNVKNGAAIEGLGAVNLIVGDNAVGKTAAVESVIIGLTGRSLSVGAVPSRLMSLAQNGSDVLSVRLGLSDGQEVSLSVEGTTERAGKPTRNGQVHAVVMADIVRAVMAQEPKRQREAFLRLIAPKSILKPARESVPVAYQGRWDSLLAEVDADLAKAGQAKPEDADRLVSLAEAIREKTRAAKALGKTAAAQAPTAARPTREVLAGLTAALAQAQAVDAAARRREAAAGRRQVLVDELAKTQPAQETGGLTAAQIAQALELLDAARKVNAFLQKNGGAACPCCSSSPTTSSAYSLENAAARNVETEGTIRRLDAQLRQATPANVSAMQHELAAIEATLAEPAQAPQRPIAEIQTEAQAAASAEAAWAAWEANNKAVSAAEADATMLAGIGKTVERLVGEVLAGAVTSFEAAASASLPDGLKFRLKLFDGKKQVCKVGLESPASGVAVSGKPNPPRFTPWETLSGAQQMLTLVGLADAWAQKEDAALKVLIIDDVWLGVRHLGDLLRGLVRVVGKTGGLSQVFVCAVSVAGVSPVEGVNLVRLDEPAALAVANG